MLATLLEAGAPSPGADLSLALGPFRAVVVVCDHAVHDVRCGPFRGEDALFRLLLLTPRPTRRLPRVNRPDPPILGDVGSLLLRFMAWETELERSAGRVGGLGRVWRVRFAALKTILDGLPEDVKRVIRLCDGTRDVRHLCAEGPLPPQTTLRVLEKLLTEGVLSRADVLDDLPDTDGGIDADRRWQQARESTLPSAATTTTPPSPAPPASSAPPTPSTPPTAVPPPTTSTPAETNEPVPPAPATAAPAPAPTAPPTASPTAEPSAAPTPAIDPVVLARHQATPAAMVSGETALPRPTPRPTGDLQAWLGEEDAFFADADQAARPKHTPWPLWQLALLILGGGVFGGLVARACG